MVGRKALREKIVNLFSLRIDSAFRLHQKWYGSAFNRMPARANEKSKRKKNEFRNSRAISNPPIVLFDRDQADQRVPLDS